MNINDLIFLANLSSLATTLQTHPELANNEIALSDNPATAHPLHRICDGVINGMYSEETGVELAKIFLNYGAQLNSIIEDGRDSPLTAACSLRCDQLALLYVQQGARLDHRGCHGGTALHWAAWCGRDLIVEDLIARNAHVNQRCIDFKSTPLFWTIHGFKVGGKENRHHQLKCVKLLLSHGADPSIPNLEGTLPVQLLEASDKEFLELF